MRIYCFKLRLYYGVLLIGIVTFLYSFLFGLLFDLLFAQRNCKCFFDIGQMSQTPISICSLFSRLIQQLFEWYQFLFLWFLFLLRSKVFVIVTHHFDSYIAFLHLFWFGSICSENFVEFIEIQGSLLLFNLDFGLLILLLFIKSEWI